MNYLIPFDLVINTKPPKKHKIEWFNDTITIIIQNIEYFNNSPVNLAIIIFAMPFIRRALHNKYCTLLLLVQ